MPQLFSGGTKSAWGRKCQRLGFLLTRQVKYNIESFIWTCRRTGGALQGGTGTDRGADLCVHDKALWVHGGGGDGLHPHLPPWQCDRPPAELPHCQGQAAGHRGARLQGSQKGAHQLQSPVSMLDRTFYKHKAACRHVSRPRDQSSESSPHLLPHAGLTCAHGNRDKIYMCLSRLHARRRPGELVQHCWPRSQVDNSATK